MTREGLGMTGEGLGMTRPSHERRRARTLYFIVAPPRSPVRGVRFGRYWRRLRRFPQGAQMPEHSDEWPEA